MKLPKETILKKSLEQYFLKRFKLCSQKKPTSYILDKIVKAHFNKEWTYYEYEIRDGELLKLVLFNIRKHKVYEVFAELTVIKFDDNSYSCRDVKDLIRRVKLKNNTSNKLKVYLQRETSSEFEKVAGFKLQNTSHFIKLSTLAKIFKKYGVRASGIDVKKYSHERDFESLIELMQRDQKRGKGYYNLDILNDETVEWNRKMWSRKSKINIVLSLFDGEKLIGGIHGSVYGRKDSRNVAIGDLFIDSKYRRRGLSLLLYKELFIRSRKIGAKRVYGATLNPGIIKLLNINDILPFGRWYIEK